MWYDFDTPAIDWTLKEYLFQKIAHSIIVNNNIKVTSDYVYKCSEATTSNCQVIFREEKYVDIIINVPSYV